MKRRWLHGGLLSGLAIGFLWLWVHPEKHSPRVTLRDTRLTLVSSRDVATAISGLDLTRAERLLHELSPGSNGLPLLRARFALYRGDCDEARALLASVIAQEAPAVRELSQLSEGCARVVSGSKIVVDEARGIWVRIQDDADESWVALIFDVAARARDITGLKLGITLPRPLRIELVLDHASLSALTGLPLEAAETTGTVAVARWGRVSMLSPRSFARGYPWQDTLAHEITHLLVTAATYDNAPLWLQEALAKHFEMAWRPARPLDDSSSQHELTRRAWQQGRAVGIENLGSSIALLPSPESARIAYAEVYDFLDFILKNSGWQTLRLLLHDLRVLGPERVDGALLSATGYTQQAWSRRWRAALSSEKSVNPSAPQLFHSPMSEEDVAIARQTRLAELLASRLAWHAVDATASTASAANSTMPELRSVASLAKLQMGQPESALRTLGTADGLVGLYADWLALRGRALAEVGNAPEANLHFEWALAYAPSSERICCEGRSQFDGQNSALGALFVDEKRRPLCLAARNHSSSAGHPPIE
jgi:tetratricopeptide (TPR) repeat protein